jgi:hypothetical protein
MDHRSDLFFLGTLKVLFIRSDLTTAATVNNSIIKAIRIESALIKLWRDLTDWRLGFASMNGSTQTSHVNLVSNAVCEVVNSSARPLPIWDIPNQKKKAIEKPTLYFQQQRLRTFVDRQRLWQWPAVEKVNPL